MKISKDYITTSETMALLPYLNQYGEEWSFALEVNRTLLIQKKSKAILNDSCNFFGSSYEGRIDGTRAIMNRGKMYPIAISVPLDMYMFPLSSPERYTCVWLSYVHIFEIEAHGPHQAKITFVNGQKIIVNKNKSLVDLKKYKTGELRYQLQIRSQLEIAEPATTYQVQHETDLWDLIIDEKRRTYVKMRRITQTN